MRSPFTIFRKHQKLFLATLALLAMIAFVFLSGPVFDALTTGHARNPVVVRTHRYGTLTELELANLLRQQNVVRSFFERLYWRMGLRLPVEVPSEESVVNMWILAHRARELGLIISNNMINEYLREMTANQVSRQTIREVLREMRISDRQLFEALRMELAARQMLKMLEFSTAPTTPAQRWEYFQRLNRRATVELVAEPVAKYLDRIADPEESTLREFFERYKENYYDPASPEPGFRRPHRVVVEYLKADIAQFLDPASISDEQVRQYYEEHKDTYYLRSKLPPVEKAAPKTPPEAKSSSKSPAQPSQSSAGSSFPKPKSSSPPPAKTSAPAQPHKPASAPEPKGKTPPSASEPQPKEKPIPPSPKPGSGGVPKTEKAERSNSAGEKHTKEAPSVQPGTQPAQRGVPSGQKGSEKTPAPASSSPPQPKHQSSTDHPPTWAGLGEGVVLPRLERIGLDPAPSEAVWTLWTTSAEGGASAGPARAAESDSSRQAKAETLAPSPPAAKPGDSSLWRPSEAKEAGEKPAAQQPVPRSTLPSSSKPSLGSADSRQAAGEESPARSATGEKEKLGSLSAESSEGAGKTKSSGGAASPTAAKTSKYVPLEEVQEEIREALARGQARAKIEQILQKIRDQMSSYSQAYLAALARGEQPPARIFLQELGKPYGLQYRKTRLVNEWELRRDDRDFALAQIAGRESVIRFLFYQGRPPLQPTIAQDPDAYYLFWKLEDAKEGVPSWDYTEAERLEKEAEKARARGQEQEAAKLLEQAQRARKETDQLRQEVLRTWKMIQARSLARNRAAQLAELARKTGKSLREALANEPGVTVLEAGPFSWLSYGGLSPRLFVEPPPPRISPVPHVEMPGEQFMRTVFRMEPGQVAVAFNQPQTVAYVIRVKSFEPSREVLWKMFLAEPYTDYAPVALLEQQKIQQAWLEQIKQEIGFRWERRPHPAAGR